MVPNSFPRPLHSVATLLALLALSTATSAELLVGKVVDSSGVGVGGVDIDVENENGGGDPTISNDGTDANGNFAVTISSPGVFRISFNPPPPPASSDLALVMDDVAVVGTVNLGTVTLPAGVAVSGRAVTAGGLPVAGVDLDVIDANGDKLDTLADTTNAFGQFAIAVPAAPIELRFDTSTVSFPTYAGVAMDLDLSADLNLGDVVLPAGLVVSGTVTNALGTPLAGVDLDVESAATGADQYVPKDNTNGAGQFSLVVPQGTWDVWVCPTVPLGVVAHVTSDLVVNGGVSLGTIALQSGVLLSGSATTVGGQPLQGIDIDVDVAVTGVSVPLCSDNTNASGVYSVIVPTGTYDVTFTPPFSAPYATDQVPSVGVFSTTNIDGVLADCPFGTSYGSGLAGAGGFVPVLSTSSAPRLGNPSWGYDVGQGVGGTFGLVWIGIAPSALPIFGGQLLIDILQPNDFLFVVLGGAPGTPGAGSGGALLPITVGPAFVGFTLYAQALLVDGVAPEGLSLSDGRAVTFCD